MNLSFTSQSPDKNFLNILFFSPVEKPCPSKGLNFLIPPNHWT